LGIPEGAVMHEGGRWVTIISLIALIFSGISLYETVLKQARLKPYIGEIVRYGRTADNNTEAFSIPITITNYGARDAAVTGIDLKLIDGSASRYVASYIGDNPAKENLAFAPIVISGRGSYSANVLFYPLNPKPKNSGLNIGTGRASTHHFCLKLHSEMNSDYGFFDRIFQKLPPIISFTADLPWFASSELTAHRTVPMVIKKGSRKELNAASNSGECKM
jgi:hypothetical protein